MKSRSNKEEKQITGLSGFSAKELEEELRRRDKEELVRRKEAIRTFAEITSTERKDALLGLYLLAYQRLEDLEKGEDIENDMQSYIYEKVMDLLAKDGDTERLWAYLRSLQQ